jgi:hypothetical protein
LGGHRALSGTPLRSPGSLGRQACHRSACTMLGIRQFTIMRSLGIPAHVVAAWHGHDEAVMARTYTHTYLDGMRAAAQLLAGNV